MCIEGRLCAKKLRPYGVCNYHHHKKKKRTAFYVCLHSPVMVLGFIKAAALLVTFNASKGRIITSLPSLRAYSCTCKYELYLGRCDLVTCFTSEKIFLRLSFDSCDGNVFGVWVDCCPSESLCRNN